MTEYNPPTGLIESARSVASELENIDLENGGGDGGGGGNVEVPPGGLIEMTPQELRTLIRSRRGAVPTPPLNADQDSGAVCMLYAKEAANAEAMPMRCYGSNAMYEVFGTYDPRDDGGGGGGSDDGSDEGGGDQSTASASSALIAVAGLAGTAYFFMSDQE